MGNHRKPARSVAAFGLALVLAACSLTPDYQEPQVALPDQWQAASSGAEQTVWPEPGWWRAFGSPSLDSLIAAAERNNTDIGAAAARVLQADAQVQIAGASLWPSLGLSASGDRGWTRASGSSASNSADFTASLAASYEIDLFGKNHAALVSAEVSALGSRFGRDTVALTVVSNVANSYFQVLQLRERLEIARNNLDLAEQVLEIVTARVENGAAAPLELAQQRTVVANQRAAVPALEQQVAQAENALAILLGIPPHQLAVIDGTLMRLALPSVSPGLPSELLQRRPDVQAAEAQLIAANADIGAARAAFFPSLDLTGQAGSGVALLPTLFDPISASLSIAGSLAQTIFDGGRIAGQVDLAEARKLELIESYRQAVLDALGDVENALVAVNQTAVQESLQTEAAEQARLAYQLAEIRYREGAEDLLTVLDAQRSLFQAEDQLVQTRLERLQAAVALYRALGGGWHSRDRLPIDGDSLDI